MYWFTYISIHSGQSNRWRKSSGEGPRENHGWSVRRALRIFTKRNELRTKFNLYGDHCWQVWIISSRNITSTSWYIAHTQIRTYALTHAHTRKHNKVYIYILTILKMYINNAKFTRTYVLTCTTPFLSIDIYFLSRQTTLYNIILYHLHSIIHLIMSHYTTLHYTTLHYTTLHYTTLHYTTLHYTTLHYITLHYTALHYTTLHYTTLHYATLHYTTLHYITLQ